MAENRRNNKTRAGDVRRVAASRRKPVRRPKRKKHLRAKLFFAAFLAAAVFVVLSLTVLFRIEGFQIEGETRYSAEEIVEASGIEVGKNLFLINRKEAVQKISEKLPYIGAVTLKLRLPGSVTIAVEEEKAVAVLETANGNYYISAANKVLQPADDFAGDLTLIKGAPIVSAEVGKPVQFENDETVKTLQNLFTQLEEAGLENITQIDLTDTYFIRLRYEDRYWIKLSGGAELFERLRFAKYVIDNRLDPDQPGTLDLTLGTDKVVFNPDYGAGGIIIPPSKTESTPASSKD